MGLQLCVCRCGVGWSPQLFDFFLVEWQLDFSSVTARLRVTVVCEFVTRGRVESQQQQAQLAVVVFEPPVKQQQEPEIEKQPEEVATAVEGSSHEDQSTQKESSAQRTLEPSQDIQIFKRKVKRRLVKNGAPVLPSPSSRARAVSYRGAFAEAIFNRFNRISTRFKIKYKSKLSFQRFIFLQLSKNPHHLLDIQLSFDESERFTPEQWQAAYPSYHSQCLKMKLSLNDFHSKSLMDFRKNIGYRWAQRYLVYYQAKDIAISNGLYWNITLNEFLHLAATKQFVPLRMRIDIDKFHHRVAWFRRCHIKSIKKLPSTNPTYNVDGALFDNSFVKNKQRLWELLQPFVAKIPASLYLPHSAKV
ncbi:hypothetical protein Taro_009255 [Colocasia esculenta]|uniref:Uncharacterized protein n=1 Tax=Colocasia esculenta TaxID=4460 RepID=A0A843U491_COLES|nr:hypothetical protein [Colocasia esculenta]